MRKRLSILLSVILLMSWALIGCSQEPTVQIVESQVGQDLQAQDGTSADAPDVFPEVTAAPQSSDEVVIAPAPGDAGNTPDQQPTQQAKIPQDTGARVSLALGAVVGAEAVIHPLKTTYRDFLSVNALVYESLVELDDTMKPVPLLADRWTYNENGEWTFTLRSGIVFHDGSPLTAHDVVASYQEALHHTNTVWYSLLQEVEGMRADDDLTVSVKAKGAGHMMLYAMTFPVLQRDTISMTLPRGTGPYWYIDYQTGQSARIETNPLWWKRSSEEIHGIDIRCYRSTLEAMAAIESGMIDALSTRDYAASLSRTLSDRMAVDFTTTTYECVIPNLTDSLLSNINIRRALMYAIDRSGLAGTAYLGMVQESEVPVVPGSWLYNAQATRFNFSLERALQLLYDDGWTDLNGDGILEKEIDGIIADFELSLYTYNEGTSPIRAEAAYAIADSLKRIGIRVNVTVGTRGQVAEQLKDGNFQLALVSYQMSQLPHLAFMVGTGASLNYSRYTSDEMDSLLHEAYDAQTEDELISAMGRIQMKIVDDLPILGLFFRTGVTMSKVRLSGLHGLRDGQTLRGLELVTVE